MRDFLPAEMLKREYVFDIVRDVFHLYGFEPLQTPVLELNEILMGKYGEDAEKLIYQAQHPGGKEELALRYDLTVPLARVVGQYQNDITLPFKRYQLSPVWRAERPQRGRYREFYQCDVDIVGVADMSADAEVIGRGVSVLKRLGFPQFTVKINNRKLLTAIGQYSGVPDAQLGDLYRSVDKFDKIGAEGVAQRTGRTRLIGRSCRAHDGFDRAHEPGSGQSGYARTGDGRYSGSQEGIRELRELATYLADMYISRGRLSAFDFTMVRGLGYYTGPIYETVIEEPNLGSISGGGRYDDLLGLFRKRQPAHDWRLAGHRAHHRPDGCASSSTRITSSAPSSRCLSPCLTMRRALSSTRLAAELRAQGICIELHLEDRKLGQQFQHADRKGIPLVAVLGPEEIAQGGQTQAPARCGGNHGPA